MSRVEPVPIAAAGEHLGPEVYRAAAELRAALRRFERRSEQLARKYGVTPQQYTLLLLIKGAPDGSERATVSDLTARLQLSQSSVSELVHRAVAAGFIGRTPSPADARVWWLTLTEAGDALVAETAAALGAERRDLADTLAALRDDGAGPRRR